MTLCHETPNPNLVGVGNITAGASFFFNCVGASLEKRNVKHIFFRPKAQDETDFKLIKPQGPADGTTQADENSGRFM
jgi:hypothetical protein